MSAAGWLGVGLALCATGCMASSTRLEAAGPPKTIAWRTGRQLAAPPRARVTLTTTGDGLDARVEAVRSCSSELLRTTPRVEVRETTPRTAGMVTVGLAAAVGVLIATRDDDRDISLELGAVFLVPAALAGALMWSASGVERKPAPPALEKVKGPDTTCDVQPWTGALLTIRTSQGTEDGYADRAGIARLKSTERPRAVFVNGEVVEDMVRSSQAGAK